MNETVALSQPNTITEVESWSRGAELLSVHASLDSSTWKLGILENFKDPELMGQINRLATEADVANPFFDTTFLSASVENIGCEETQFLFLSETVSDKETLKMFAPVVLTRQGISRKPVLKIWTHLYAPLGVPLIDAKDDATIEALKNCLLTAHHKEAVSCSTWCLSNRSLPKSSIFQPRSAIGYTAFPIQPGLC